MPPVPRAPKGRGSANSIRNTAVEHHDDDRLIGSVDLEAAAPIKSVKTRKALLVAVPELPDAQDFEALSQPMKDLERMLRLLSSPPFNYSQEDLHCLCGPQATRDAILLAIQDLVRGTGEGDVRLFYFNGHASQIRCVHGTETDKNDEVILPYDAAETSNGQHIENGIIDNELHRELVLSLGKGCHLTCFVDACHSGTSLDLPFATSWNEQTSTWELKKTPTARFSFDLDSVESRQPSRWSTSPTSSPLLGGPRNPKRKGAGVSPPMLTHMRLLNAVGTGTAELCARSTSLDRKSTGEIIVTDDTGTLIVSREEADALTPIITSPFDDMPSALGLSSLPPPSRQSSAILLSKSLSRVSEESVASLKESRPKSLVTSKTLSRRTSNAPKKTGSITSRRSTVSETADGIAVKRGKSVRINSTLSYTSTRSVSSAARSPTSALGAGDDYQHMPRVLSDGEGEYDSPEADYEEVVCWSSSTDEQQSWESPRGNTLTEAIVDALSRNPMPTYRELLDEIGRKMEEWSNERKANFSEALSSETSDSGSIISSDNSYVQTPQLSTSRKKDLDERLHLY